MSNLPIMRRKPWFTEDLTCVIILAFRSDLSMHLNNGITTPGFPSGMVPCYPQAGSFLAPPMTLPSPAPTLQLLLECFLLTLAASHSRPYSVPLLALALTCQQILFQLVTMSTHHLPASPLLLPLPLSFLPLRSRTHSLSPSSSLQDHNHHTVTLGSFAFHIAITYPLHPSRLPRFPHSLAPHRSNPIPFQLPFFTHSTLDTHLCPLLLISPLQ